MTAAITERVSRGLRQDSRQRIGQEREEQVMLGSGHVRPRQSIVGGLEGVCRQRLGGCNLQLQPAKVVLPKR